MENIVGTSKDPNLMESCAFCPIESRELYKCPKCNKLYCSLKCYRSEKHWICSESFYKDQIKNVNPELIEDGTPQPETSESNFNPEMFEDYMKKFVKETRSENEQNPQIRVNANEDIRFDSDDEPDYIRIVAEKSLDEFEKIDMNDLDRKLTLAGLAGLTDSDEQMEYLYQQLNDEEKKMFNRLADNIQYDEMGLMNSVFAKKPNKKK